MSDLLPMGWLEVPVAGHVTDGGTSVDDWEATSNPRHPRQEIRRWQRGQRFVRICKVLDRSKTIKTEWPYCVEHGKVGNDKLHSHVYCGRNFEAMLVKARLSMRLGGY